MPILGIIASGVVVDEGAYELISTTVLTGDTASVTFSSLGDYSSTYKHLQIRSTSRTSLISSGSSGGLVRFNGDTGNNYAWHRINGNGSSVISQAVTSTSGVFALNPPRNSNTANAFAGTIIDILDPYSTSKNTTVRSLSGYPATFTVINLHSGFWNDTASITSITMIDIDGGNWLTGSRFSLYGIRG